MVCSPLVSELGIFVLKVALLNVSDSVNSHSAGYLKLMPEEGFEYVFQQVVGSAGGTKIWGVGVGEAVMTESR